MKQIAFLKPAGSGTSDGMGTSDNDVPVYESLEMPSTEEITVSAATLSDIEKLGELGALLMSIHYDIDSRRFIAVSDRTPLLYASYLGKQLGRSDVMVLVAKAGSEIAGYVYAASEGPDYMALRGPAGVIHDLIVEPRWRRQGAGRLLLRTAISNLTALGVERIVLSTAYKNEQAQALFASEGFHPTMVEMTREIGIASLPR